MHCKINGYSYNDMPISNWTIQLTNGYSLLLWVADKLGNNVQCTCMQATKVVLERLHTCTHTNGTLYGVSVCKYVSMHTILILCLSNGSCRSSLHTNQISHSLLYPSLWLLVHGLSSQFFFAIISYTTDFWCQHWSAISFRNSYKIL